MIRINLLPPEQRPAAVPVNRVFAVCTIVTVLFLFVMYAYYAYWIWFYEGEIMAARNRAQELGYVQSRITAVNARKQALTARNSVLLTLTKDRVSWPALIVYLAGVMPDNIWFEELGIKNRELSIKGMAADYADLAEFLKNLENNPRFASPVLVGTQLEDRQLPQRPAKFEITVKFKGL